MKNKSNGKSWLKMRQYLIKQLCFEQPKTQLTTLAIIICFIGILVVGNGCMTALSQSRGSVGLIFPWPPPKPSAAWTKMILSWNPGLTNWGQCADLINTDLEGERLSYFNIPDGFAIVTSMNCVDDSGVPMPSEDASRSCETPIHIFSKAGLLAAAKRLFSSELGRCRVVVYIITDKPFPTPKAAPPKEVVGLLNRGADQLSADQRKKPLSSSYALSVLIYEYTYSPYDGALTQVFSGETEERRKSVGIGL